MTTQEQSKSGQWTAFSYRTWTGSEQWDITHHQFACFLEDPSAKCQSEAIGLVYEYH